MAGNKEYSVDIEFEVLTKSHDLEQFFSSYTNCMVEAITVQEGEDHEKMSDRYTIRAGNLMDCIESCNNYIGDLQGCDSEDWMDFTNVDPIVDASNSINGFVCEVVDDDLNFAGVSSSLKSKILKKLHDLIEKELW